MQEPHNLPPKLDFTPPASAKPQHGSAASFLLQLPEARAKYLPVSPLTIVRLVVAWLVLFISLSAAASYFGGKPTLSQYTPVGASRIRQNLPADEERRANINSLDVFINKFYDRFAVYPSTYQINSPAFRSGDDTFKVANRRTFMDPKSSDAMLAAQPTVNQYFYTPLPVGCQNSNVECTGYIIGAVLENGQVYSKQNTKE